MKKTKIMLLLIIFTMLFTTIPVSAAIKITPKTINLVRGEKKKLKINTKKKVKWSSKNKKIATISKKGKVSAKKRGKTTVYAQVGKKKYLCTVNVYNIGEYLTKTYRNTGSGTCFLRTEGGTTENGNVPILYRGKSPKGLTTTGSIGVDLMDLESTVPCWVYIDKVLQRKISTGAYHSVNYIPISWDTIKFKTHTVEIIQYRNDNPKNDVIFYRKAKYKVKKL